MLRRPTRAALAAAAFATVLSGCPGGRGAPPPERFVPATAHLAIVLPEAGRAARAAADLHATVSAFPGASELEGWRTTIAAQLGFDPLDPAALDGAGIDPRRGAALALLEPPAAAGGAPAPLLVLPAGDADRLDALFARLARDRLGATERAAERKGEVSVVVARRPGDPAPALAWAFAGRTAFLCAGPSGPEVVRHAAGIPKEGALAEAPAWQRARGALGEAPAAVLFLGPGSRFLEGMWAVKDGLAVELSASPGRLGARAAVLLGLREPSFRALAPEAPGEGAKALARLDPAAQLAARWDGDFAALGEKLVPMLPEGERRRLAARAIDPRADLFALLAPGGALTLSLSPRLEVAGLTAGSVRADPLRAVEVEAVLPVRDPAAAEEVSRRIAGAARGGGGGGGEHPIHRVPTPSGEIAWRVEPEGRRVLLAAGAPGRIEAVLARPAGGPGWRAPTKASEAALSGGLGGVALDVPRLVEATRALPDEAFGTGPSAFVLRSLVDRIVEPAARLRAVSLHAGLAPGALLLSLEIEAKPAAEARP